MAKQRTEQWHVTQVGIGDPLNPDRSDDKKLFDKVCDAIGVGASYVHREVMGDIHAKLIDEMWFGRNKTPTPYLGKERAPSPAQQEHSPATERATGHGFDQPGRDHDFDR